MSSSDNYLIDPTLSGDDDEDGKLVGFEVADSWRRHAAEMTRHHIQQFGPRDRWTDRQ